MALQSINPATEEIIATYEESTPEQIESALAGASAAFRGWRETTFAERYAVAGGCGLLAGEQRALCHADDSRDGQAYRRIRGGD